MGNHIPFLVLKSGNISRKFVTKKMRSCDKNFGQLQKKSGILYKMDKVLAEKITDKRGKENRQFEALTWRLE